MDDIARAAKEAVTELMADNGEIAGAVVAPRPAAPVVVPEPAVPEPAAPVITEEVIAKAEAAPPEVPEAPAEIVIAAPAAPEAPVVEAPVAPAASASPQEPVDEVSAPAAAAAPAASLDFILPRHGDAPIFEQDKDVSDFMATLPENSARILMIAANAFGKHAVQAGMPLAAGLDAADAARQAGRAFFASVLASQKLGADPDHGLKTEPTVSFRDQSVQDWFSGAYERSVGSLLERSHALVQEKAGIDVPKPVMAIGFAAAAIPGTPVPSPAGVPAPAAVPSPADVLKKAISASGMGAKAPVENLEKISVDVADEADADVRQASQSAQGIIESGDAPVRTGGPQPNSEKAFADRFPGRPLGWPVVMAWPMQPAYRLMEQANSPDTDIAKYMAHILERRDQMKRRAVQIRDYILEHNNPTDMAPGFRGLLDQRTRRRRGTELNNLKTAMTDTHFGIKWATLLTDNPAPAALSTVASWGFNTATTQDGGSLVARKDNFTFRRVSQQAIALALYEGQARGWSTFRMQGTPEFTRQAITAAKHMNVAAEITELYGPYGLFKRKHIVMPAPPGQEAEVKSEELDNGKSGPVTTVTPSGVDLRNGEVLPEPKPGHSAATLAKRPDPGFDVIFDDDDDPFQEKGPRAIVPEDEDAHMSWNEDGVVRNPAPGM